MNNIFFFSVVFFGWSSLCCCCCFFFCTTQLLEGNWTNIDFKHAFSIAVKNCSTYGASMDHIHAINSVQQIRWTVWRFVRFCWLGSFRLPEGGLLFRFNMDGAFITATTLRPLLSLALGTVRRHLTRTCKTTIFAMVWNETQIVSARRTVASRAAMIGLAWPGKHTRWL